MSRMTGRQALMEVLQAEGVEYVFGNPGTSESPIMEALEHYPGIRYVLATQEGVAMGMADGLATASGKPAFVNLHIETGLANGISLLQHAMEGGTPLILSSGNKDIRGLAEGRTDLPELTKLFTKWSVEVTHPEQLPGIMRRAFTEAKTPPMGPVFVGFSANALDESGEMEIVASPNVFAQITPDHRAVDSAAKLLAASKSPFMVVGDRLAQSGGVDEAVQLAELLGIKVYAATYGQMNFPTRHPMFMGRFNPGMPGSRELFSSSDIVLAIGVNVFPGFFYFSGRYLPAKTKLVHVDSALREIGKSQPTDVGVHGDPKMALKQMISVLSERMSGRTTRIAKERRLRIEQETSMQSQLRDQRIRQRWNQRPMIPERMMHELSSAFPKDGIIVDDSISSKDALHSAFEFKQPGDIFAERGGALGWGIGGAMGIKLAHPDKPVIGIIGDGTAMMTVQGFWTAANEDIPVVWAICNNRSYRILKLNMDRYQKNILGIKNPESQYIGMDFPLPLNLARMAEATGVSGLTIEDPEQIGPELKKALDSGRPSVLDIMIDEKF
ncbi:thiamine pyrophosphate-binding protein [SAR202 cluster bacterium AD-804-J14_MRT_500m]|nr:thiamine pyrophosphate-binding protein [SAR202 cluster bacterium AD-804-J14_MRT_500m]